MRQETKIFRFLFEAPANSTIYISSWGISNRKYLEDLISCLLRKNCKVKILIGFSKETHAKNNYLMDNILSYLDCHWQFKVLPSFHAKIWAIESKGKINMMIGSSNFTPNTIHNIMIPTNSKTVLNFLKKYWRIGTAVSKSTKLELIPEIK